MCVCGVWCVCVWCVYRVWCGVCVVCMWCVYVCVVWLYISVCCACGVLGMMCLWCVCGVCEGVCMCVWCVFM